MYNIGYNKSDPVFKALGRLKTSQISGVPPFLQEYVSPGARGNPQSLSWHAYLIVRVWLEERKLLKPFNKLKGRLIRQLIATPELFDVLVSVLYIEHQEVSEKSCVHFIIEDSAMDAINSFIVKNILDDPVTEVGELNVPYPLFLLAEAIEAHKVTPVEAAFMIWGDRMSDELISELPRYLNGENQCTATLVQKVVDALSHLRANTFLPKKEKVTFTHAFKEYLGWMCSLPQQQKFFELARFGVALGYPLPVEQRSHAKRVRKWNEKIGKQEIQGYLSTAKRWRAFNFFLDRGYCLVEKPAKSILQIGRALYHDQTFSEVLKAADLSACEYAVYRYLSGDSDQLNDDQATRFTRAFNKVYAVRHEPDEGLRTKKQKQTSVPAKTRVKKSSKRVNTKTFADYASQHVSEVFGLVFNGILEKMLEDAEARRYLKDRIDRIESSQSGYKN